MTTTTADRDGPAEPDAQYTLGLRRQQAHARCVVCGGDNDRGLGLVCEAAGGGAVVGVFQAEPWMAGYEGQLHGGVIAALLDSAMTQCLFAHDHAAVTAKLSVRYLMLAPAGVRYTVEAHLVDSRGTRHRMKAKLVHHDQTVAEAKALFLDRR